jgi:hypothetical protein
MTSSRRPTKAEARRARAEAARAAIAQAQRRRRTVRIGVWSAAAAVLILVVWLAVVALDRPAPAPVSQPGPTSTATATGRTTNPPWPAPSDATAAVSAAGLPMLGAEGTALHIHAHLDVIVNGAAVQVPADIGIDNARQQISPLHTHDTTGVIHIESPQQNASFTLGQFFTEWNVALSANRIGGLVADGTHHVKVYVNGTLRAGDPASLVLAAHDEIALVYGPDSQSVNVPKSYAWTNGL